MTCRPPSPSLALSFAALAMLWTAGCTPAQPIVSGPVNPVMWQVSDGDTRIILLGSVHQLPPELDWQDARVKQAVADADELWLELSPAELAKVPDLFAATSHDEAVQSLDRRISPTHANRVRDEAGVIGMNGDDMDVTESWALALTIAQIMPADMGFSTDNGVETVLTRRFADAGKRVRGMETAAGQLAIFDALPDAVQNQLLIHAVTRTEVARARLRTMIRAWAAGDADKIAQLAAAELALTPGLAEQLLHARNRRWAAALDQRMQRPGTVMIAVGTGHLVGNGSLPALLAERGYRVVRLP